MNVTVVMGAVSCVNASPCTARLYALWPRFSLDGMVVSGVRVACEAGGWAEGVHPVLREARSMGGVDGPQWRVRKTRMPGGSMGLCRSRGTPPPPRCVFVYKCERITRRRALSNRPIQVARPRRSSARG